MGKCLLYYTVVRITIFFTIFYIIYIFLNLLCNIHVIILFVQI